MQDESDTPGELPAPFEDFKSPEDVGFNAERMNDLVERSRPRESEA